ncbi:hypothetical protein [Methanomethylovorans hollandica]|nr:hypothetical protein [Methanomethylovorans hollandica]
MGKEMIIEEVKNPWRLRNGVVVFDIETEYIHDFSIEAKKMLNFKCGVAFVYNDGEWYRFYKPEELVKLLKKAKTIVSYNGEGFDFLVLEKHGLKIIECGTDRWKPTKCDSFDIMHTIQNLREDSNKKYPSLEEMMKSHYGISKTPHDPDNIEDLMKHCLEDVKYTKKLYEEKTWLVPVKERPEKREWEADYDNDLYAVVDDGENCTRIIDFGMPIAYTKQRINDLPGEIRCPLCGKGILQMYSVYRAIENEIECPECHGLIGFVAGTNEIMYKRTKEELESNVCPNCKKYLGSSGYEHHGYGAGSGYISSGRRICSNCSKGCYEWEKDDTPGFRDSYQGKCCNCGE